MSTALFDALFTGWETAGLRQRIYAYPDVMMNGVQFRTGSGEYVGSIQDSVLGDAIINSDHEVVGYAGENIMGGTSIQFTDGGSINGIDNIYGGENFYDLGDLVGYTQPNMTGGMDLMSPDGETLLSGSEGMFGMDFTVGSGSAFDGLDALDAFDGMDGLSFMSDLHDLNDMTDVMDLMDVLNSMDTLHLLTSWF